MVWHRLRTDCLRNQNKAFSESQGKKIEERKMTKLRRCICDAKKIPVPRVEYRGMCKKHYFYFCTSCLLRAESGENILEGMAKWNDMIKIKTRCLKKVNKRKAKK